MRTDEAVEFLGQRINVWTSVLVFLAAAVYFVLRRGAAAEFVLPLPEGERGFRAVGEAEFLAAQDGSAVEPSDGAATDSASPGADSDPPGDAAGDPAGTAAVDHNSIRD
jgi:hypothetical protein